MTTRRAMADAVFRRHRAIYCYKWQFVFASDTHTHLQTRAKCGRISRCGKDKRFLCNKLEVYHSKECRLRSLFASEFIYIVNQQRIVSVVALVKRI